MTTRRKSFSFIVAALVALMPLYWSCAADYYVDPVNGNDSNSGTNISSPWRTIGHAAPRIGGRVAGDTVILRGGIYSGSDHGIDLGQGIGNSGEAGRPITIKAFPGELPIVTGMNQRDAVLGYPVNLKAKAFYVFDGIMYSNNYAGAAFTSCTNFVLSNCIFTKMPDDAGIGPDGSGTNYAPGCVVFKSSSQSNVIANCVITNWGVGFTNVHSENQWMVAGSPIIFGDYGPDGAPYTDYTWYNLVQGCVFARCGHDLMGANMGFLTVRANLFYNDSWRPTNSAVGWQYYNYGNPRTENNRIGAWGARIQKTGGGDNDFTQLGLNLNTPDLRQVWEDNTLLYAAFPADSAEAGGLGITTRLGIYRRNTIAFCMGAGIYLLPGASSGRSTAETNNPAFYHSEMIEAPYGTNSSMCTLNCIYNNVIYGNGTMVPLGVTSIRYPRGGIEINNGGGQSINNFIVNNIIWANWNTNISPDVVENTDIYGRKWHQILRTNWTSDGALANPLFASTEGFGFSYSHNNALPDFHLLPASPCIDAATWLTKTIGAGRGTTLPVFNSLYFSDGNHMVAGDTIQLQGQTQTAVVLVNDWTNNILYLDNSLTWTNGQGVSLAYTGAAPDMGAYESAFDSRSARPTPPRSLQVVTNTVP